MVDTVSVQEALYLDNKLLSWKRLFSLLILIEPKRSLSKTHLKMRRF
jgi:hypothetical protein